MRPVALLLLCGCASAPLRDEVALTQTAVSRDVIDDGAASWDATLGGR